jgi:hypothetical protein
MEMKKFYVWGTGPAQSTLIREAEDSHEAAEVAMENGFEFTSPDDWAVEVKTSEEEIDEATRFDDAVAGYVDAEQNETLTDIQFHRAYALAKQHGHEWTNVIPKYSPLRNTTEIATVVDEANKENCISYVSSPVLKGNIVMHTSGSGRVSWKIHPDGTVNITISRPGGAALWGILSPNGTFTCGEVIGGVKFATRHIWALVRCYSALESYATNNCPDIAPTLHTWELTCALGDFRKFIIDIPNTYGYEAEIVGRILYERIADIINMLEKDSSATGTFGLDGLTWHWRANLEGDVCITTY